MVLSCLAHRLDDFCALVGCRDIPIGAKPGKLDRCNCGIVELELWPPRWRACKKNIPAMTITTKTNKIINTLRI